MEVIAQSLTLNGYGITNAIMDSKQELEVRGRRSKRKIYTTHNDGVME